MARKKKEVTEEVEVVESAEPVAEEVQAEVIESEVVETESAPEVAPEPETPKPTKKSSSCPHNKGTRELRTRLGKRKICNICGEVI